jgi:hypothetical protein
MKLDLSIIKKQIDEYHVQVAEVMTGFDIELEHQKKETAKIRKLEISLLWLMEKVESLEKSIKTNHK